MPNLVNADAAGNVFYNYITPVVQGESANPVTTALLDSFLTAKLGAKGIAWNSSFRTYSVRFPAPGFETKTTNVSTATNSAYRVRFENDTSYTVINSNIVNNTNVNRIGNEEVFIGYGGTSTDKTFGVINDWALVLSTFSSDLTTLKKFMYVGWLREPVYTGSLAAQGLVCVMNMTGSTPRSAYLRPVTVNSSSSVNLSTAANAITSPPIVCTPGTTPGSGSATWTDIVIRDAASPNNPVGKLWNCVDMPASYTAGGLYKNVGAYDADGSTSAQDIYLCVMAWGTRKLGMRIWTENV